MKTETEAYGDGREVIPTGSLQSFEIAFSSHPLSSLFHSQFEWQHVGGTITYEKQ